MEKQCTSIAQIGDLINVTATVTNPGDTPLSDIVVSDDLAGELTYVSGDTNDDGILDIERDLDLHRLAHRHRRRLHH